MLIAISIKWHLNQRALIWYLYHLTPGRFLPKRGGHRWLLSRWHCLKHQKLQWISYKKQTNIFLLCTSQIFHTSSQLLFLDSLLEGGRCLSVGLGWKKRHCNVCTKQKLLPQVPWQIYCNFTCLALWAESDTRWLSEARDLTWQINLHEKFRLACLMINY